MVARILFVRYRSLMPPPLAYFLTWTCYGTWLHGDERGSVDREHWGPGLAFASAVKSRVTHHKSKLKSPALMLTPEARVIVETAIRDHCVHRGWNLLAINARTNHVHVVLACGDSVTPETAMTQFKAWATRRLREQGLYNPGTKIWTQHGSTRWINDHQNLEKAVHYVKHCQ